VREVLIDLDDDARQLVWSVVDGPYTHRNHAAQVIPDPDGSRFSWSAEFLPHPAAVQTDELMDLGLQAVKQTLQQTKPPSTGSQGSFTRRLLPPTPASLPSPPSTANTQPAAATNNSSGRSSCPRSPR
jgi:hypothetical protein